MLMWNLCSDNEDFSVRFQARYHDSVASKYPALFMTGEELRADLEWWRSGMKGPRPLIAMREENGNGR